MEPQIIKDQSYGEWYRDKYPEKNEDLDDKTDRFWRGCDYHTSINRRKANRNQWIGAFRLQAKRDPRPEEIPNRYWGYPETQHFADGTTAGASIAGKINNGIWQDSVTLAAMRRVCRR